MMPRGRGAAAGGKFNSGRAERLRGRTPAPGILGASQICPSNIYTYTAQSSLPSASFEWQVKNGSSTTTKVGSAINVKWGNTPPFALTLRQTDESGLAKRHQTADPGQQHQTDGHDGIQADVVQQGHVELGNELRRKQKGQHEHRKKDTR